MFYFYKIKNRVIYVIIILGFIAYVTDLLRAVVHTLSKTVYSI